MLRFFLFLMLFPLTLFCQNIVSSAYITKESESPEYINYTINIFPGRNDKSYSVELFQLDNSKKEVLLCNPNFDIKLNLIKKEWRDEQSGYTEWWYKIKIKENGIWTDEYIEIANCTDSSFVTGNLRLKRNANYKIIIHNSENKFFEQSFEILNPGRLPVK